MATGISTYNPDIVSLIDNIHEAALFTLRQQSILVRTVTVFSDNDGMEPRDVTEYGSANPRSLGEGEDVTPTNFNRSVLTTLTPERHGDQFVLTDQRIRTDYQNVASDAAMELGSSFATYVDEKIATNFSSLTGGTVGAAGSALTWSNIYDARAKMGANNVPMGPQGYFCALHDYQWNDLVQASLTSGAQILRSDRFQDSLIVNYYTTTIMAGVTFVVTSSIAIDADDDAVGAMYSPRAMAYDERMAFTIEPQRDSSRQATELNANLWFAHGTWRPIEGVQIISDATSP
jgi:hypothetical protein